MAHVSTAFVALAIVASAVQLNPWNLPASAEYPDRFEGLISPQVANPRFELLSFTGAMEPISGPTDIKVDFYLRAPLPVRLRAQELKDDRFYRMEAKPRDWTSPAWNTFGPWPTSAVIVPTKVLPSNIGVVVYLNDASPGLSGELAPAFVYRQSRPTSTKYTLILRTPQTTLREVRYAIARVPEPSRPGQTDTEIRNTAPGEFVRNAPVYLDFDLATLPAGSYRLQIECIPVASTAPIVRDFTFYHAGEQ